MDLKKSFKVTFIYYVLKLSKTYILIVFAFIKFVFKVNLIKFVYKLNQAAT
jgi:hypothetical protein